MLVLSRQRDQSVVIGRKVEVKVVDIRGDKVRLGFIAPAEIEVDRKEVFEQKQAKMNAAAPAVTPQEREAMDPFLRAAIDEAKKGLSEGGLELGRRVGSEGCGSGEQENEEGDAHWSGGEVRKRLYRPSAQ